GQSFLCSSSRVTTCPGRSSSIASTWNDWSGSLIRRPCFRSSPEDISASKGPKRTGLGAAVGSFTEDPNWRGLYHSSKTPPRVLGAERISCKSHPFTWLLWEKHVAPV